MASSPRSPKRHASSGVSRKPVPATRICVPPCAGPSLGNSEMSRSSSYHSNERPAATPDVPPSDARSVVLAPSMRTWIGATRPADASSLGRGGVEHAIAESLTKRPGVTIPPTTHAISSVARNAAPLTSSRVPPRLGPERGHAACRLTAGRYSSATPSLVKSTPFTDTSTDTSPAACAGATHVTSCAESHVPAVGASPPKRQ